MFRRAIPGLGLPFLLVACQQHGTEPADTMVESNTAPASAEALVRTEWPSPNDPGPPYYARIEPAPPHFYVVGGLAVVAFYRDPVCIRPDFNLLAFFDPPAAFGCRLTVQGFSLWEGAPFSGRAPKITEAMGTGAVPFWFIPAEQVMAAAQDGLVTIGELAALPGRITGEATQFGETLHPGPTIRGGGHPHPMLDQAAAGTLEDGRSFQYHVILVNHALVGIELHFE